MGSGISATPLPRHSLKHQRGMSVWAIAFNIVVFGGLLLTLLRIVPSYMEYLSVKDQITRATEEFKPNSDSLGSLRDRLHKGWLTGQIDAIPVEDIKIFRDKGKVIVDASYEVRFPIVWIIDGVMKFEDLVFEVGS